MVVTEENMMMIRIRNDCIAAINSILGSKMMLASCNMYIFDARCARNAPVYDPIVRVRRNSVGMTLSLVILMAWLSVSRGSLLVGVYI